MRDCLDTDAIVTIAGALDWDVDEGLRHLQLCADCRAQLDVLQSTRAALLESEPVEPATVARIADVLSAEAQLERTRARRAQRWVSAAETLLAAVAAPIVLVSSGVRIGSIAAAVLTCVLGAALLWYGRRSRLYTA